MRKLIVAIALLAVLASALLFGLAAARSFAEFPTSLSGLVELAALVGGTLAALRLAPCLVLAALSQVGSPRTRRAAARRAVSAAPVPLRRIVGWIVAAALPFAASAPAHAADDAVPPPGSQSADLGWSPTSPARDRVDLDLTWSPTTPVSAEPEQASDEAASAAARSENAPPRRDSGTKPSRKAAPPEAVVVEPGDTLWAIAAQALGTPASNADIAAAWPRWHAANREVIGADPDLIFPGQRLIPPGEPS